MPGVPQRRCVEGTQPQLFLLSMRLPLQRLPPWQDAHFAVNQPNMFTLQGRVAVVTGGNGGIGLGMARGLSSAGAHVVVAARNEEKSRAAVEELSAAGTGATAITVDVTNDASVAGMVEDVVRRRGR